MKGDLIYMVKHVINRLRTVKHPGIHIIAVYYLILGLLELSSRIISICIYPDKNYIASHIGLVIIFGVIHSVRVLIYFILAYGLWKLSSWGKWLAILYSIFSMYLLLRAQYSSAEPVNVYAVIFIVIDILIIGYLLTNLIRQYFKKPGSSSFVSINRRGG
jgi:uncharacterized membrane protein (DUF2068 family)